MKYRKIKDGQWVQPKMKGYKMMCCDCGLVHIVDFKIVWNGKKVRLRASRDDRRTALSRRTRKNQIKNLVK